MHIGRRKTRTIERGGHFHLPVHPLLAQDRDAWARADRPAPRHDGESNVFGCIESEVRV